MVIMGFRPRLKGFRSSNNHCATHRRNLLQLGCCFCCWTHCQTAGNERPVQVFPPGQEGTSAPATQAAQTTIATIKTAAVCRLNSQHERTIRTVALNVPPSCSRKYMSRPLFSLPAASGMDVGSMLKIHPSLGGPSEYRSYLVFFFVFVMVWEIISENQRRNTPTLFIQENGLILEICTCMYNGGCPTYSRCCTKYCIIGVAE